MRVKVVIMVKGRKKVQNKEVEEEEDSKVGIEVDVFFGLEVELLVDE